MGRLPFGQYVDLRLIANVVFALPTPSPDFAWKREGLLSGQVSAQSGTYSLAKIRVISLTTAAWVAIIRPTSMSLTIAHGKVFGMKHSEILRTSGLAPIVGVAVEIEAFDDKESEHRQARLASQYVANEIISGNLKPGAEIQAIELSASGLLSVRAMLEGIPRLLASGLVTDDDNFFRVAEQSPDDLADLMHTRFLLEGVALRDSIMNGDEEWERSVTAGLQGLIAVSGHARRCPEAIVAHKRFHQALVAASRLRRVREYLDTVYDQWAWYSVASDGGGYCDFSGHRSLADVAVARDVEAASEQLRLLLFSAGNANGICGSRRP